VSVLSEEDNNRTSTATRRVVGVLGIMDPIESEAPSTVAALQGMGLDVWLCTGDHELTALACARQVGIDESNVCAQVSPEGKADLVTRLQKRSLGGNPAAVRNHERNKSRRKRVAVVGDGINDAVALARADVGIAIGAGTEVAVEAADVVLVRSSLHDVVMALHLSRVVFHRIRWNFLWALGYNLVALPFAAGLFYPLTGFRLPPAFAGLMMAFSSVSVVTSSLLLRLYTKPIIHEDGHLEETSFFSRLCCWFRQRPQSSSLARSRNWHGYRDVAVEDASAIEHEIEMLPVIT
jgi:Cu+-exporting ATPase